MVAIRSFLLLVAATVVTAQLEGLDGCAQTCINGATASNTLGCAAGDAGCLCQNEDFAFGVSDCSKANCPPEYYKKVEADVEAWCAAARGPPPAPSETQPPPSPSAPAPSPSSSSSPPPSSAPAQQTSSQPPSPTSSASSSTFSTSTTSGKPSSHSASKTASSTSTAPSSTSAASEDDDDDDDDDEKSGLSTAAMAGIGVGAAAGGIAIILIAGGLFIRHRRQQQRDKVFQNKRLQISDPISIPGRGPSLDAYSGHRTSNDLEMRSRRYEDMVPRVQPRTLV